MSPEGFALRVKMQAANDVPVDAFLTYLDGARLAHGAMVPLEAWLETVDAAPLTEEDIAKAMHAVRRRIEEQGRADA